MITAAQKTANNFKEIKLSLSSSIQGTYSTENVERQKEIISSKAAESIISNLETSAAKQKFEDEVINEVVKSILNPTTSQLNELKFKHQSLPEVLKILAPSTQSTEEKIDLNKKYFNIIKNIMNSNREIKNEYENNLKKIIEMLKKDELSEVQLKLVTTEMADSIKNKIPGKEEVKKILNQDYKISNLSQNFDFKQFKDNVKLLVDNLKGNKIRSVFHNKL